MQTLQGKAVVVTGAGRGLGAEYAVQAALHGASVVVNDVDVEFAEHTASRIAADGGRAVVSGHDVADHKEAQAIVEVCVGEFGRIDGLVNNAGILRFNELVSTPLEEFQLITQVNQVGAFLGIRTVAPEIEAAGGGTIVNTASYTALTGMAFVGAYTASKHAILGLTRVAALELAAKKIRVNAVCPGAVDTPMTNPAALDPTADPEEAKEAVAELYKKLVPLGRIGRPEEVAKLALFLSSDDSSYITGQPFVIDGGWLAGVSLF